MATVKIAIAVPDLPHRIRSARRNRGMSQSDLGRAMGWTKHTVSQIENDQYSKSLSIDIVLQLESVLEVTLFSNEDLQAFTGKLWGDRPNQQEGADECR